MKKIFLIIMVALTVISCGTKKEEVDYDLLREKQKTFVYHCQNIVIKAKTECIKSGVDEDMYWERYLDANSRIELKQYMDSVNKYNLKMGYTTPYNFDFDY